jgi:hypothetical protein
MRSARFVSLLVLISIARSATAHQATASAPQATTLLQQSLTALSGGKTITDVTLSGTVERIAGSDDEFGTVVIQAVANGSNKIALSLPSGTRSETRTNSSTGLDGSWSGPDGIAHTISYHNLLTDGGLFPTFTLAGFMVSQNTVLTYIGQESKNGAAVIHITAYQQAPDLPAKAAALSQHLSQVEIFLDATTLLPQSLAFNIHPDENALRDIPVEIDFSNYTVVNGVQVPFHIQKYINNSLALDLQINSALLNSGFSVSTFTLGVGL